MKPAVNALKKLIIVLWLITLAIPPTTEAQNRSQSRDLVYTVQPGDTLVLLALHYNLKVTALILANPLNSGGLIFPGQKLILPGVAAPKPLLSELPPLKAEPHVVQAGETLYAIAGQNGTTVGALALVNNLLNPSLIETGQSLQIPASPPQPPPLAPPFAAITLSESPIIQGRTAVIQVTLTEPAGLLGMFEGQPLFFKDQGNHQFWSLIPIHALAEPNLYPIILTAVRADGAEVTAFTNIEVSEGPYGWEEIQVDQEREQLLNEDLITAEQQKLAGLWAQVSPTPRWEGPFRYPVAGSNLRITSYFGTRRSYNGSSAISFHGGADFGGGAGLPIYAAAPGRVVLAEALTVRGNAVVIDHGMGLYTGYWHQSQLAVAEGQEVQAGDLLGYTGDTGLVTGPHLHWEMRLYGIAVDPTQWVHQAIP